jgi:hypothetical protein
VTVPSDRLLGGAAAHADSLATEEPLGTAGSAPVTLTAGSAPAALPLVTPCKGRGAETLSRLVCADAWWPHPIGQGQIHRGDLIEVFPIISAPVASMVGK